MARLFTTDDNGNNWCDCEYQTQCYGGSKYFDILCKMHDKLKKVSFLKEVNGNKEEDSK